MKALWSNAVKTRYTVLTYSCTLSFYNVRLPSQKWQGHFTYAKAKLCALLSVHLTRNFSQSQFTKVCIYMVKGITFMEQCELVLRVFFWIIVTQ